MIHYQLRCSQDHEFDGWFKDSAAFDKLAGSGMVECPVCGDQTVNRALMAPAVASRAHAVVEAPPAPTAGGPAASMPSPSIASAGAPSPGGPAPGTPAPAVAGRLPDHMRVMLQRLRAEVEKNCDYVGPRFAEEALRIHRGEADARGIYGETTPDQAQTLSDEGVSFARIPWVNRADG